jgi:hypothetical protein
MVCPDMFEGESVDSRTMASTASRQMYTGYPRRHRNPTDRSVRSKCRDTPEGCRTSPGSIRSGGIRTVRPSYVYRENPKHSLVPQRNNDKTRRTTPDTGDCSAATDRKGEATISAFNWSIRDSAQKASHTMYRTIDQTKE